MPDEDYKITDVVELLKSRFVTLTGNNNNSNLLLQ